MSEIKLFDTWTFQEEVPEPFLQLLKKEGLRKTTTTLEWLSQYNQGRQATLHAPTLRAISLIGVEGHECGHQNYSSIYLRRKYIKGIEEGILYPTWPIPETKQEAEDLECMKMYFRKKDFVFLGVYLETAGKLHGYLEDVFVEEQMWDIFFVLVTTSKKQPERDPFKSDSVF